MTPLRQRLGEYLAGDLIAARVREVETRLKAEADARVREAYSAGMSRADEQLAAQGFRRLTANPSDRDLNPLAQDAMLDIAYWLWEANPLAQWLIEVVVDFVWGEGGKVEAADDKVRAVVERFWQDPVNALEQRYDDFIRELGLQGELCLPVAVNEYDGHVRLAYVDPCEIDEVITDPDNALVPVSVVLKGRDGRRKRQLKVVREDTSPLSDHRGLLMPALPGETDPVTGRGYDGSCLLTQVNKLSGARRGRSDLLPLIDWLDGYDALLFDFMDRARQLGAYIWDVELQGMDETQIAAWLTKNSRVRRGMVRAHNERVKWQGTAPDIKSYETDEMARLLRGHIIGSKSLPEHFYGLGGDVTLATAKEMSLPTIKRMTRRQKTVKFMIREHARFAVHQAIRVGALPRDVDQTLTATLPEMSMRDTSAVATALGSLTVALTQAEELGWIRKETAAKLFGLLASQLGAEIDSAAEVAAATDPARGTERDYNARSAESLRARLASAREARA